MSIMESIAVAFHYKNIHLFYRDISNITWLSVILIYPGLIYLRYKKIINLNTLKYLGLMVVLASVLSGCLYNGWSWIYLFYILLMYVSIVTTEKEIQKEEQKHQNDYPVLDYKHKREKRKLSGTTKMFFILFSIASLISAILNYFQLVNL
ncbi:hypothetical protein [Pelosinus sp. IPA-1]|uniref:hypothetical protein n=1 Tax=Pelosinus sp. IPA-1 TaxID=3029569 RepID=UPI002436162C|nr:hypothetical protein [Pelosinus sp. IPA-1]GMA99888.1 hypothetical protein PIPA1_26880 [Pelosinus sp. IPA-1]